jgi:hypothetical protein
MSSSSDVLALYNELRGGTLADDAVTPSVIVPGRLYLGSKVDVQNVGRLGDLRVTHVLSMAHSLRIPLPPAPIVYLGVDAHDRDDYAVSGDFDRALAFLDAALVDPTAVVLVHCAAGVSRSAIIVALYVAHSQHLAWDVAVRAVHACRPCICPNMGFLRALRAWDVSRAPTSASPNCPSASACITESSTATTALPPSPLSAAAIPP